MYKKILVPLDGSTLAECVLPHVQTIAMGCGVPDITLLRAFLPRVYISGYDYEFPAEEWKRMEEEGMATAKNYLLNLAKGMNWKGATVNTEVLYGPPADSIVEYATKNGVDLIVIATHGRSGVSRWVWGSVADRILHSACVPVLMVRAPGCVPGV